MNQYLSMESLLFVIFWIELVLIDTARSCMFEDPCARVKCPNGEQCDPITPYCQRAVCTPVAVCEDPCRDVICRPSEACVVVAQECRRPLCPVKARCNARLRFGRCPDEPRFITSCTPECEDDHLCPKNYKCCKGFCVPPIL